MASLKWKIAGKVLRAAGEAYGIYASLAGAGLIDEGTDIGTAGSYEGRKAVLVFTRTTPTGTVEDVMQVSFHIVNITSEEPDSSWITADYTSCETRILTWWTSQKVYCATSVTLKEIRWYRFGPAFITNGPPRRVTAVNVAGTNAALRLPDQVAATVTLKTVYPKSWGRVYLPGVTTTAMAAAGRLDSTTATNFATYFGTLVNGLATDDFGLVVFSRLGSTYNSDGKMITASGALLGIKQVQVDDVLDVQRRRRARQAATRAQITV